MGKDGVESGGRRAFLKWGAIGIGSLGVGWTARNLIWYGQALSRMGKLPSFAEPAAAAAKESELHKPPFDAIAVLSPGMDEVVSCLNGEIFRAATAGDTGILRIDAALHAYDRKLSNTIIMLGAKGHPNKGRSDAELMEQVFRKRADELAIDISGVRIIWGTKSKNTTENMKELKEIADTNGFGKILTITNDFHMFNSILLGLTYEDDVYAFVPEDELPRINPEYAKYIDDIKKMGRYISEKKEWLRFGVMFFNQDLQLAEALWSQAKKINGIEQLVSKNLSDQPDKRDLNC